MSEWNGVDVEMSEWSGVDMKNKQAEWMWIVLEYLEREKFYFCLQIVFLSANCFLENCVFFFLH